ncbi:hypothetical protein CHS0354_026528 [Potamilus streckersoni]|uniref:Intradiol ring-cleavage dioxygenases domain-containing protein n=1 Tax=Potamilus streckersoni TaxID=2493646 RepID=A0AAE0VGZ9_9BIVA|nr:hypothetical protein CHS0354_026528 [Potamilus streckersoni]
MMMVASLSAFLLVAAGASMRKELLQCKPTTPDVLGPYYFPDPPKRRQICIDDPEYKQRRLMLVEGYIFDEDCKNPISGAKIEVWQADHDGHYLFQANCRGYIVSGETGFYVFLTIHPGKYAIDRNETLYRPAHVHFRIVKPGYKTLVTQMYFNGDSNLGSNDACNTCSSGNPDLVVRPQRVCVDESQSHCLHVVTFDIVMQRGDGISVVQDENDDYNELFDVVNTGK